MGRKPEESSLQMGLACSPRETALCGTVVAFPTRGQVLAPSGDPQEELGVWWKPSRGPGQGQRLRSVALAQQWSSVSAQVGVLRSRATSCPFAAISGLAQREQNASA